MPAFSPISMMSNSNGGQAMPTLSAVEYKGGQAQKDKGGGVCPRSVSSYGTREWRR